MKKNNAEHEFLSLLGRFFTEYLPVSMNASAHTVSSYKCAFRLLFQYLNEEAKIDARHITFDMLNFDLLTGFFDWLVKQQEKQQDYSKTAYGSLIFVCGVCAMQEL